MITVWITMLATAPVAVIAKSIGISKKAGFSIIRSPKSTVRVIRMAVHTVTVTTVTAFHFEKGMHTKKRLISPAMVTDTVAIAKLCLSVARPTRFIISEISTGMNIDILFGRLRIITEAIKLPLLRLLLGSRVSIKDERPITTSSSTLNCFGSKG